MKTLAPFKEKAGEFLEFLVFVSFAARLLGHRHWDKSLDPYDLHGIIDDEPFATLFGRLPIFWSTRNVSPAWR